MTIYEELSNRLRKLDKEEKGEFTDIYISALMASDNLLKAFFDLKEDIALFKESYTPESVLEVNKSWKDFAYKAKNIAEILGRSHHDLS